MKILFVLGKKTGVNGMNEIHLEANKKVSGKTVSMRARSGIFILPCFLDNTKGIDINKRRVIAPDVRKWHNEAKTKLDGILSAIANEEGNVGNVEAFRNKYVLMSNGTEGNWLERIVDEFLHPQPYMTKGEAEKNKTFYELAEDYLAKKSFSYDHAKGFRVLVRAVARYEGFVRATDNKRKDFVFNVHTIDRNTIEDFMDYLKDEKCLSEEYPNLYAKLVSDYPASVKAGHNSIEGRGENATIKLMKKLKAFFHWLVETERTTNKPFDGIRLGSEKYGTPYYITIEERNTIASTQMPTKHLETQRDIFVFHCLVGCRVGDLVKLTACNIHNGVLEYAPHKTKDEGEQSKVAKIPLSETAQRLISKYKGVDKKGRILPFVSPQKYNDAIKEIFTIAGITRNVIVRNALTGENETRQINEVASSHLARRTFVGNAYKQVADPSIIARMSGHVEGSRAFVRYRNIDTDTLKDVISKIDRPAQDNKRDKLIKAGFTAAQVEVILGTL